MIYKKDDIDMSLVSCDFEENSGYTMQSFTDVKAVGYSIFRNGFYQL